jgi:hypothetical protein
MSGPQQLNLWRQRAALPTARGANFPQSRYIVLPNIRIGSFVAGMDCAPHVRLTTASDMTADAAARQLRAKCCQSVLSLDLAPFKPRARLGDRTWSHKTSKPPNNRYPRATIDPATSLESATPPVECWPSVPQLLSSL